MELQYLIDTYHQDAAAKRRHNFERVQFETHKERNLYRLYQSIQKRSLTPTAYTFIVLHPKPREVFACDIPTQVCQYYIESAIRPFLELELIDTTYNNRIGKGSSAAVDNLISDIYEVSEGFTNPDCWIIKVDMQGYFPNASQDVAYTQLSQLLLDHYKGDDLDDILFILQRCIYAYPTEHCTRKSPMFDWALIEKGKSLFDKPEGIGGAIGYLIWQCAMSYYINDICHWLVDECGLKITVYMDDIVIVTSNKEVTLGLIPELRDRLAAIGVTLHPRKFYCQHYSKGVEFLGYHIKMDRLYVNRRTCRNAMNRIRRFNGCIGPRYVDSFVATVNSYLGLFKNCNGHTRACRLLKAVDRRWWKFVEYDKRRVCIRPKEAYKLKNRIIKQYKLRNYDKKRTTNRNCGKRGGNTRS